MTNPTTQLTTPGPERRPASTADTLGIHPLNAAVLIALDFMLFSGEMASGFLLTVLSMMVAFMLVLPSMLVQRFAYKDGWILSFAKSLFLAILTAIPTALPSTITAALGVTGAVALRNRANRGKVIEAEVVGIRK